MRNDKAAHRMTPQLVLGVFIILLGVVFMLDHLDVLDAGSILQYWPVLVILYGLSKLGQGKQGRGMLSGVFFMVVGSLFLLSNLEVISFHLWDYWPVVLVFMGFMLVWRALGRHRASHEGNSQPGDEDSRVNSFVMFGGVERRNSSQDFKGGEITAILGGCEIDLRGASIKNGAAVIDVFTFWGGIDIKVPDDWTVSIESMPLMGGCEDKTKHEKHAEGKHLIIKGYVIMGGLEIG